MTFLRGHALTIGLMLVGICAARAGEVEAGREPQVKAAFVYNFIQFVEWPDDAFASARAPIVVGFIGSDEMAAALQAALSGKESGGRPITFRRLASAREAARECHVLLLSGENAETHSALEKAGGTPILLVGDAERFCEQGGIIRLFREESRMRFEVNPQAAERARLRISAKLMKLARIYEERK